MFSLNVFLDSSIPGTEIPLPWIYAPKAEQALELILNFSSRNRTEMRGWLGLSSSSYKEGRGRWWENVSSWTCCYCSLPGDRELKDGVWCLVLEGAPLTPPSSTAPAHSPESDLCKAAVTINHGRGEVQMFVAFFLFSKQIGAYIAHGQINHQ